jgi:hypothetical protein
VNAGYEHIADIMVARSPDSYVGYDTPEAKREAAMDDIRENLEALRELRGAGLIEDPNAKPGEGQPPGDGGDDDADDPTMTGNNDGGRTKPDADTDADTKPTARDSGDGADAG